MFHFQIHHHPPLSKHLSLDQMEIPQSSTPTESPSFSPLLCPSHSSSQSLLPSPGRRLTPAKVSCLLGHGEASLFGQPSPRQGGLILGAVPSFTFRPACTFSFAIHSVFSPHQPLLKWGNVISLPRGGGRCGGGWREARVSVNPSC